MLRLCASAHKPSLLSFSNSSAWVHNVDDFSKPKICFFCHTILIMISKLQKYELTNIVFVSRTQLCMSKEYRAEHWTWKSVFFLHVTFSMNENSGGMFAFVSTVCVYASVRCTRKAEQSINNSQMMEKKNTNEVFLSLFLDSPVPFPIRIYH